MDDTQADALLILQSQSQIEESRRELEARRISCLSRFAESRQRWRMRLNYRLPFLPLPPAVIIGDKSKSWDLLLTVEFIERSLQRDDPVLDLGVFQSEILCSLHKAGFSQLTGLDLHPDLPYMPDFGALGYVSGDFLHAPYATGAFGAVTAISVIEHGFQPETLLAEISRLLRPGGYFVASFDYWPEKHDTTGILPYDMSWTIFSQPEVAALIDIARSVGLHPAGKVHFAEPTAPVVELHGLRYTFGWLVLRKHLA